MLTETFLSLPLPIQPVPRCQRLVIADRLGRLVAEEVVYHLRHRGRVPGDRGHWTMSSTVDGRAPTFNKAISSHVALETIALLHPECDSKAWLTVWPDYLMNGWLSAAGAVHIFAQLLPITPTIGPTLLLLCHGTIALVTMVPETVLEHFWTNLILLSWFIYRRLEFFAFAMRLVLTNEANISSK